MMTSGSYNIMDANSMAAQGRQTLEAQERNKRIQEYLNQMHGVANAKDAGGLRRMRDTVMQAGMWGGDLQKIYEGSIGDAEAREKADQEAKQRQVDVGNQKNALINQYGDSARRGLANSLLQTQRDANKRGLLYSGQHEGARADLRSQAAADMAGYRTQVNQAADDQLGSLAQQSAQRGLQTYQTGINQNVTQYQDALKRYNQRKGMFDAIGEGVGKLGGLL